MLAQHLLAANVICATVPMEVGPPCRITFLATLNTYAPARIRPPPEMTRQLQQLLNSSPALDAGPFCAPVGNSGVVDIDARCMLIRLQVKKNPTKDLKRKTKTCTLSQLLFVDFM